VVAETIRNQFARWVTLVVGIVVAAGVSMVVLIDASRGLETATAKADELELAGRNLVLLEGTQIRGGEWCSQLGYNPAVAASGAIGADETIPFHDGTTSANVYRAEPSAILAIDPRFQTRDANHPLVGAALVGELGLSELQAALGDRTLSTWSPPAPAEQYGRSVVLPLGHLRSVETCVARLAADPTESVKATIVQIAQFASNTVNVQGRWYADPVVRDLDAIQEWQDRPSRWLWLLLGCAGAVLIASLHIAITGRDLSVFRLWGVTRSSLVAAIASVQVMMAGPAVSIILVIAAVQRDSAVAGYSCRIALASLAVLTTLSFSVQAIASLMIDPWKKVRQNV